MIYISIDNDHQGAFALTLMEKLRLARDEITFISLNATRNNIVPASGMAQRLVTCHPLCDGSSYKNPLTYLRSFFHQVRLSRSFEFCADDVLILNTEYQINNALLAKHMRQSGGSIFLYDEGISFYFNNSPYYDQHVTSGDRFFLTFYNLAFKVLGIPARARKGFEGRMYVRINPAHIDRIYLRMRLPVSREEPIEGYRNFLADTRFTEPTDPETVVFFATNLTAYGLKDQEVLLSRKVIAHLSATFKNVLVKIHPADCAEKNDIYLMYQSLVGTHPNVKLIDNSIVGNDAIRQFRPRVVVGTVGATLFDAFSFGCQTVFLFPLLDPVAEFDICRYTLERLSYNFIRSVEEIRPEYQSGVHVESILYSDELKWDRKKGMRVMPCQATTPRR